MVSGDHPIYYNTENGQNTEKSIRNLRRLAVIQTPMKDHQLMLMRKTLIINPESVLENETHTLFNDFEKQIDHLISPRRPDFIITNKK